MVVSLTEATRPTDRGSDPPNAVGPCTSVILTEANEKTTGGDLTGGTKVGPLGDSCRKNKTPAIGHKRLHKYSNIRIGRRAG